jgi:hypothetical protein
MAMLLLLCQTVFAAQACAHALAATSPEPAAVAPCHQDIADTSHDVPAHSEAGTACEAAKATGDGARLPIYTLADLPATTIAYTEAQMPVAAFGAPAIVQAVCFSPPLGVLHCRFNN